MRYFSRLPLPLLSCLVLTYIFLGFFAVAVNADSTGFLALINTYRAQNGLGTLTEDQNLTNAACWFSNDMRAKNYFPSDHVDSQGRSMSQRLSDFGVSGSRAENIFYTTSGSSANYSFEGWKNSSGHNANMLSSTYTRIGIGRANYNGKWYWVTDFANGTATTMTNQCGVSTTPPPNPPPTIQPKVKTNPPPVVTPPIVTKPAPIIEAPLATMATAPATETQIATKSATISTKKIVIKEDKKPTTTLVQGAAATTIVLGNLILFGFIALNLYKHHKFLQS